MDGGRYTDPQFGQAADDYDRIRPGYPGELIDAVFDRARAPYGGAGQATLAFAARGIDVTTTRTR